MQSSNSQQPDARAPLTPDQLQQVQLLRARVLESYESGQYEESLSAVKEALLLVPDDLMLICNRAINLSKLERNQDAYDELVLILTKPLETLRRINLCDTLTPVCAKLGKLEEAKRYGNEALIGKAALPADEPVLALPALSPPALSRNRFANVISFSLFGSDPRYCETAFLNVLAAQALFPQWACRFYCDATVPLRVLQRLQSNGAQICIVNEHTRKTVPALLWRDLVIDDPTVERFLLRDADSILSARERGAVDEWLASGQWFHCMRDWWTHTELLLAGMWGGCTGVLRDVQGMILRYVAKRDKRLSMRVVDQHFLRTCIWPTVRQSMLTHDTYFDFMPANPFPKHEPVFSSLPFPFSVGCNFASQDLRVESKLPDDQFVEWMLHDGKSEICRYRSAVKNGQWCASIPHSYADNLLDKKWKLCPADDPKTSWSFLSPRRFTSVTTFVKKTTK